MKPKAFLWIALTALTARFLCSGVEMQIWVDSRAYLASAQALLEGRWADFSVERTPGYPLFLIAHTLLLKAFSPQASEAMLANAVGITQALLGVLTALLSADIAYKIFRKPALGVVVGLLTALAPNLILAEHTLLTETLYTFSLMLTLWFWLRTDQRPSTTGLLITGLAAAWLIWVRPVGIILPVIAGWCLWRRTRQWKPLAFLAPPVLLAVLLWVGFQAKFHDYLGLTAGGGLNQLYKTVSFVQYERPTHSQFKQVLAERSKLYPPGGQFEAVNDTHVLHAMAEKGKRPYWQIYLEDDRTARAISMEAITTRPFLYAAITLQEAWKLLTETTPWDGRLVFWLPLLLLAVVGSAWLWRHRAVHPRYQFLLAVLWGHLALYPILTVCTARYRVPFEPLFIILATYGALRLLNALRQSRTA